MGIKRTIKEDFQKQTQNMKFIQNITKKVFVSKQERERKFFILTIVS